MQSIAPVCWSWEVLFSVNLSFLLVSLVVKEINAEASVHLKED